MALFQCELCSETFGNKLSHYCLDKEFVLVKEGINEDMFIELVDWEFELITNNKNT
jgi:hypothetical protein